VKFNFKQLKDAIAHMGYDINDAGDSATVDIEIIGEDPGNGELVECLRIAITYVKPPTNYSKAAQVSKSLEVYSDTVKSRPRYAETKHTEI
jgi:hypothetical protein